MAGSAVGKEQARDGGHDESTNAVNNSPGELFAIKVMQKCRKTAKMTIEQQRELSIMKGLSTKHDHIINLLGWRDEFQFAAIHAFVCADLATVHQRWCCSIASRKDYHVSIVLCSGVFARLQNYA